tara:strand:- start:347 stop:835 length:489 start_codon:yes stop_codon:yes gene_type:complete
MQGYVNSITSKSGQGARGPWTLFSIEIDGQKFGAGFDKPNVPEGSYVEFDVVQKGQYKNAENIRISTATPPVVTSGSQAGAPVNKRDCSIQYQSSRKDAIQMLGVLLTAEAIKLPAKQADKYDAAMAIVEEMTAQFFLKLEAVIEDGGVSLEDAIPVPNGAE